MAVQFSLRRHRGRLSTLFLAMVLAGVGAWAAPVDGTIAPVDGAIVCEDTASVLKERDGSDKLPPDFMVKCTAWTFFRMKMMGDVRTVRFKPSYKGEMGEYCWSRHISCSTGESLTHVYVVMPTHASVLSGTEGPTLSVVSASHRDILKPSRGEALLPDKCGLRYDVLEYFNKGGQEATFCLKMDAPADILEEDLRCPPFLVSIWLPAVSLSDGDSGS